MTHSMCGYPGDRDEALVTYLYDDGDGDAAHAMFEAHLAACVQCRDDLAALRGVRAQLGRWHPPEPRFARSHLQSNQQSAISNQQWWRAVPAWAQVAAALLFLGA